MTYSTDSRVMCLRAWQRWGSCRKVGNLLGIGKSTVNRWVKGSFIHRRKHAVRKVTDDVLVAILRNIEKHPFDTPAKIASNIKHQLGVALSGSCVRFWMRRSQITRKKAGRMVTRAGLEDERRSFGRDWMQVVDPERVVSIDESSFYFDMKPSYGYCSSSRRLRVAATPGGRTRWSLLMAVTNERVIGWKLIKGSVDNRAFAVFVGSLQTDQRDVLLLDNASIHKTALVERVIDECGLTPLYLPPYTPEFQPIEHCFCVLKTAYRATQPHGEKPSEEDVARRLESCLESLTSQALPNMFRACWDRAVTA